ncbi:MAG: hypothetical protein ACFE8B_15900 [Candidatus Hermodarchaeota archaeon]
MITEDLLPEEIIQRPIQVFYEIYFSKQTGVLFIAQFLLISLIFSSYFPTNAEKGFLTLMNTTGVNMPLLVIRKALLVGFLMIFTDFLGWAILMITEGFILFASHPSLLLKFWITCFTNLIVLNSVYCLILLIIVSLTFYTSYFLNDFKFAPLIPPIILIIEEMALNTFFKIFPLEEAPDQSISLFGIYYIFLDIIKWKSNNTFSLSTFLLFSSILYLFSFYLSLTILFRYFSGKREFI